MVEDQLDNSIKPVTPEQHSHSNPTASKKNAELGGAPSTIASITGAMQWHRQYMLWNRIEYQAMVRTLSMLKRNTSLGVLIRAQWDRPKVTIAAQ